MHSSGCFGSLLRNLCHSTFSADGDKEDSNDTTQYSDCRLHLQDSLLDCMEYQKVFSKIALEVITLNTFTLKNSAYDMEGKLLNNPEALLINLKAMCMCVHTHNWFFNQVFVYSQHTVPTSSEMG